MKKDRKFAIIGGDLRQIHTANLLSDKGYNVSVFGFEGIEFNSGVVLAKSIEEVLGGANIVVLPLPALSDSKYINTPFYKSKIEVLTLFQAMGKNQLLLLGRADEQIETLAKVYGIYAVDYFKREELTVLNAIPTAEGAIEIALSELPITLNSSSCLVLGFGRIGKFLAKDLLGIGAKVCVEARKHHDLATAKGFGYDCVHLDSLADVISKFDVIFNTIPALILDRKLLSSLKEDALVIDIASKPGGVDWNAAKELGIKTIWALSLPGKVAPVTSGEIIMSTILNILDELGV